MKTHSTQPMQPTELPQITSPIDTPTELLLYLTLFFTLGTNAVKSLTNFTTELKKLKKQWNPDRSQKRPNPKKRK